MIDDEPKMMMALEDILRNETKGAVERLQASGYHLKTYKTGCCPWRAPHRPVDSANRLEPRQSSRFQGRSLPRPDRRVLDKPDIRYSAVLAWIVPGCSSDHGVQPGRLPSATAVHGFNGGTPLHAGSMPLVWIQPRWTRLRSQLPGVWCPSLVAL